jgi:hypothetical protein
MKFVGRSAWMVTIGVVMLSGPNDHNARAADPRNEGGDYDREAVCDFSNHVQQQTLDLLRASGNADFAQKSDGSPKVTVLYKRNGRTISYTETKDHTIVVETTLEQAAIPQYVATRDAANKLFATVGAALVVGANKYQCDSLQLEIDYKGSAVAAIKVVNELSTD